ncbi:MAG: hypothetical protein Q8O67_33160 [Deltaproteobacteria bacterium]|nr:hypothetical protein [Deltaproteobacteria bacterium]
MSDPDFAPFLAAYERGRLAWALPRALVVAAFALLAFQVGAPASASLLLGVVLTAAATFAGWRSRAGLQGAFAGVVVAVIPLVMGPLLHGRCLCTGGLCFSWCGLACGAAAGVVGVVAGLALSRLRSHRVDFAAAAIVCGALGMLLCPVTGVGSGVGAVVGAVVGVGPVVVFTRKKALA